MMFEAFEKLFADMKADSERTRALYKLGVDTLNYDLDGRIIKALGKKAFGAEGWDWIEWWCFEKDFGSRADITATDKDGKEICKDIAGLWKLINDTP